MTLTAIHCPDGASCVAVLDIETLTIRVSWKTTVMPVAAYAYFTSTPKAREFWEGFEQDHKGTNT